MKNERLNEYLVTVKDLVLHRVQIKKVWATSEVEAKEIVRSRYNGMVIIKASLKGDGYGKSK